MNFILTKRCNKGCPYCFASKERNNTKMGDWDMSMEQFKKYLDMSLPQDQPKLLRGEPTQHPNFKEMVGELLNRKRDFTLISNFLFDDDILEIIMEAIRNVKVSFLINSTNLDFSEDRLKISFYCKDCKKIVETDRPEPN